MAIRLSEDEARRMPRVDDLRPWSPIEPTISSHRKRRRGGTLYDVMPSPPALKALLGAGWKFWSAVMAAPDEEIERVLRSVMKKKRREVLDLVGDLRAWANAKPGDRFPLHSWEADRFRVDMEERQQRRAKELEERGTDTGIQQATYLSLGEARVIAQLLGGREDPASVSALKKVAEVIADLEKHENFEIDPIFDAIVWEEVDTGGGYRIRLSEDRDRITRCSDTVWRRWDATILGVVVSLVDHGWSTYKAWRNLDAQPHFLCEDWASVDALKHQAYRIVQSSLPAVMPGGVLREKVERITGGGSGGGKPALDGGGRPPLEIEYREILDDEAA